MDWLVGAAGTLGACYFSYDNGELVVGNAHVERRWRVSDAGITAFSFFDKDSGREWCVGPARAALRVGDLAGHVRGVAWQAGKRGVVQEPSLCVRLTTETPPPAPVRVDYFFQIFDAAAGVTMWAETHGSLGATATHAGRAVATGIETAPPEAGKVPTGDVIDALEIDPLHVRFTAVQLVDRTDVRDNLAFESSWLLHRPEIEVDARGALFFLQHVLRRDGLIILKHAPLPHARPVKCERDVALRETALVVLGHGIAAAGGEGNAVTVIAYTGGRAGRIAATQRHQRHFRAYEPGRDGLMVSNTWGDRSKDARVSEAFILQEIEAGAKLGVDVVQIDDGWERGRTVNSVQAGGVWEGFWAADSRFWEAHPERFPNGLEPIASAAKARGMKLGLWYGPDSSHDFANWERDAAQILELHRRYGATAIKIDGVKMHSKTGEGNLRKMFERVLEKSEGRVVFDLDVTAETRQGYFGMIAPGPVFVENRYTDWHRYWPHCTLRNLWMLAQYVDPVRLRMEFLNNTRNAANYSDDPLAPAAYAPERLFAAVMFAAPLAWFEVSNLPAEYLERVAALVQVWKAHRAAIQAGPIVPVGDEPDGASWTGFYAGTAEGPRYVLAFRELNESPSGRLAMPIRSSDVATVLAGEGRVRCGDGEVEVRIPQQLGFCLAHIESHNAENA